MGWVGGEKKTYLLAGGEDLAVALAKADADTVLLAPTGQDHLVVVMQELAGDALLQLDLLGAAPGQLEEGTEGILGGTRDGARTAEITGAHVASVDGVVGELLGKGPVHVLQVGTGDDRVLGTLSRLELDLQVDVVGGGRGLGEVGEGLGVLDGAGNQEGLQGIHGDNPGRDGGTEVLAEEGSERNVLPS